MENEKQKLLQENVARVRLRMAEALRAAGRAEGDVLLCAASKMQDAATVRLAAGLEIDLFGENRVQELCEKSGAAAYGGKPLHFIGHLQTNKVKLVVGSAQLIQSVGSEKLLRCIAAQAEKAALIQDLLIEVNIGGEESKSGIAPAQLPALLEIARGLPAVRVRGLMAIPPAAAAPGASRPYFARMRALFEASARQAGGNILMEYLSMGMSGDFADAILEGANLVRVGTAIFGPRPPMGQQQAPRA